MNSNDQEDLSLIEQFKKGNKKSFDVIYKKYREPVIRFFIVNGIPENEAGDYCQDIFVNLIKYLREVGLKTTFKAFLNQIIRNKLADFYRQKKYKKHIFVRGPFDSPQNSVESNSIKNNIDTLKTEDHFERRFEFSEIITQCLSKISNERWRTILVMWLEGYKREQTSKITGIPLGSVCSCLSRARPAFLECVKKNYFDIQ